MLRAANASLEMRYRNQIFADCCKRNCLPVLDSEGKYDLDKTSRILQLCEAQIRDIANSKVERLSWWMQKLNSCYMSVGPQGRQEFEYHIGGINPKDELRVSNVCQKTFIRCYRTTADKLLTYQKKFKERKIFSGKLDFNGVPLEPPPNPDRVECSGNGNGRLKPLNNIQEAKSLVIDEYGLDSSRIETV